MERLAGRIMLSWGWRRAALGFLAGAIANLAHAPADFFAAGFIAFPLLVFLIDGAAADAGAGFLRRLVPHFRDGWWFGFGYFVVGLYWVGGALLVEADAYAWALPLAVLALPAALACFHGIAVALAALCWGHPVGRIAALAAGFGIAEMLRAVLFTGFPWNPVGAMLMPAPLFMQASAFIGIDGMTLLAVLLFAWPVLAVDPSRRRVAILAPVLILAALAGLGAWRLSLPMPGPGLDVRIVQPSERLDAAMSIEARERAFARLTELTALPPRDGSSPARLVVWPETSVPFLFSDRPEMLSSIAEALADGQMLLAGAVREEPGAARDAATAYYNSLVAIDATGQITDAADKVHRVPFGEYLPFADLFSAAGIDPVTLSPGGYSAAAARHVLTGPDGLRVLPLICYEAIFAAEVARDADRADLMVNVTVDTWFGRTAGPYQHLRQAQLRAAETGLPLVRAGNNGISAIIDSRGRILSMLGLDAVGALDATLPLSRTLAFSDAARSRIPVALMIILVAYACAKNRRTSSPKG